MPCRALKTYEVNVLSEVEEGSQIQTTTKEQDYFSFLLLNADKIDLSLIEKDPNGERLACNDVEPELVAAPENNFSFSQLWLTFD